MYFYFNTKFITVVVDQHSMWESSTLLYMYTTRQSHECFNVTLRPLMEGP